MSLLVEGGLGGYDVEMGEVLGMLGFIGELNIGPNGYPSDAPKLRPSHNDPPEQVKCARFVQ